MTIVDGRRERVWPDAPSRSSSAFAAMDPIVMLGDHDAEAGILRLDPENLDETSANARDRRVPAASLG